VTIKGTKKKISRFAFDSKMLVKTIIIKWVESKIDGYKTRSFYWFRRKKKAPKIEPG
jgi:hypothetical protein